MDEGPQRRYLEELGFGPELPSVFDRLDAIEAELDAIEPGAIEVADRLYEELAPLLRLLNRIANAVMVEEWENTGARLDEHRDSLVQAIASIMGIMLSGVLLAILLLASLRARLEAKRLERSLEQEKQASDFYGSFAAMVSHQFRTPLAIIDSGLERLLRRGEAMTTAERHHRYHRMREAVAQMTRLVDSSLTTARLDGGKVEARPDAYDLVALTRTACHLQEEASEERRIRVHASTPRIQAWCDRSLVEQVLANLFGLTPTKARIALALAEGLRSEEIAARMAIAPTTVAFHLRNLFQKTDTHRQAELIALVLAGAMSVAVDSST